LGDVLTHAMVAMGIDAMLKLTGTIDVNLHKKRAQSFVVKALMLERWMTSAFSERQKFPHYSP
jgi:hypothetical protein